MLAGGRDCEGTDPGGLLTLSWCLVTGGCSTGLATDDGVSDRLTDFVGCTSPVVGVVTGLMVEGACGAGALLVGGSA